LGIGGPELDQRNCCDRAKRLTAAERELYRWILRTFAEHGRPPVGELFDFASSLALDVEQALARLVQEDLVHRDPRDGAVVVAYPFSGTPTSHGVALGGGREVFAMCAVDALGIPFMLGEPAEIRSRDPVSGEEVTTRVEPGARIDWRPRTAVVLWGGTGSNGPSAATCCQFVHFFSSAQNVRAYLAERPLMTGEILAIPAAADAGRAIFGELLTPDEP
jgi:Alkylmercury lyase